MFSIDYDRIADLYDIYATQDYDLAFFLEEASKVSGPVLEVMAGTGRVSLPLVRAGVRLTCVDLSHRMLDVLEEKLRAEGLAADVMCADARDFRTDRRHVLAIVPFHSFSELLTDDEWLAALISVRNALAPDGRLIVTLHNPAVRSRTADGSLRLSLKCAAPEGTLVVSGMETLDPETGIVSRLQFHEIFDGLGTLRSKQMLEMRFRLTERETFERLAAAADFRVTALYGDFSRNEYDPASSSHQIWVLERGAR